MLQKKSLAVTVFFLPIILLPIIFLFVESFRDQAGWFSLESARALLLSSRQLGLLKNSLLLGVGAVFFSVLLGVPVAFFIERTDIPLRRFFRFIYLLPLLIPPYMQAIVWTKLLGGINMSDAGMSGKVTLPTIYSIPGGIFVFTMSFFPFVTLITSSGLKSVNRTLEEAALLRKGIFRTIRSITFPLIAPHVAAGALLVFVFTLVNFEVADILRLNVYPIEIFINFSAYYNEKTATMLSLPLVGISIGLIGTLTFFMRGKGYAAIGITGREKSLFPLGNFRLLSLVFVLAIITFSGAIPLIALLKNAGSLHNFQNAITLAKEEIWYSLWISAVSSFIMAFICLAVAYFLERSRGYLRVVIDFLTQIPFGIPSIVLGIGLINVWNREYLDWIYESPVILVIGYLAGYSPFVIRVISPAVKKIHSELEEVASLGTDWFSVLRCIVLPLSAPGLIAGFVTGFVLSIANLGTALLVVSPGRTTLPITIYNYMHYGAEETVFALCTVLIGIILFSLMLLWPVYKIMLARVQR